MLGLLEMPSVRNPMLLLLMIMTTMIMMMQLLMLLMLLLLMMQLRIFATGSAPFVAVCWGCNAAATRRLATGLARGAVLPP
jgi:hypothetical protein